MRDKKNRIGMLTMVFLFGIMIIGNLEAQTDNRLIGTWLAYMEGSELKYIFGNGNFEISVDGIAITKGTYITRGNRIITTITHLHGDMFGALFESVLYAVNDLRESPVIAMFLTDELLLSETVYAINGNTLTMTTDEGETSIYNRQ